MNKAIKTLQQRFTEPSADQLQRSPLCGICWSDYDGDDRPVSLPCGHVFGRECVIAWTRGTTPTGRHNGCPCCRAELLPPSLHSRIYGLRYWLDLWLDLDIVVGGPRGKAFLTVLSMIHHSVKLFPESEFATSIRIGSQLLIILFYTKRFAVLLGWKHAMYAFAFQIVALIVELSPQLLTDSAVYTEARSIAARAS